MKKLSTLNLLRKYSEILDELLARKVVRTRNAPVSDYAEWLVAKSLKLKLEPSSKSGHDAISKKGTRYQVKCRRITGENRSMQLGVIRDLKSRPFDILVAILFNQDFSIKAVYSIPVETIQDYAKYNKHQNGHILILREAILKDKRIKDITKKLNP